MVIGVSLWVRARDHAAVTQSGALRARLDVHLVLPGGTRLVLAVLFGNLGILWSRIELGSAVRPAARRACSGCTTSPRVFGASNAVDLLSGFVAGMLALALSEAAYMAEIVRAGIQSVDPGQSEAAEALGMSRTARRCGGSCCPRRCG